MLVSLRNELDNKGKLLPTWAAALHLLLQAFPHLKPCERHSTAQSGMQLAERTKNGCDPSVGMVAVKRRIREVLGSSFCTEECPPLEIEHDWWEIDHDWWKAWLMSSFRLTCLLAGSLQLKALHSNFLLLSLKAFSWSLGKYIRQIPLNFVPSVSHLKHAVFGPSVTKSSMRRGACLQSFI